MTFSSHEPGATIRTVERSDIPGIVRLLHREFAPYLSEEQLGALFRHHWRTSPPNWGWWLEVGGSPVGFLGAINSERTIAGRTVRVSNLSSWYVQPAHRSAGLRLLLVAIGRRDHVITALSPNAAAEAIYVKLGFTVMSTGFRVLSLDCALRGPLDRVRIATSPTDIMRSLEPAERQLLEDHLHYGCSHYLIESGARRCYVVAKRRRRHARPQVGVSELLYVSDVDFLLRHLGATTRSIFGKDGVFAIAIDEKILDGRSVSGLRRSRRQFALLRPEAPIPRDSLYSEMALFD